MAKINWLKEQITFKCLSTELVEKLTNILQSICHNGNCNVQFKAQNLNFANNNYEMLYFTDEDDEDYTISKYDIKVNLNKNFFGDLSFKWGVK